MNKIFESGLEFILSHEGGYSNNPNDMGGETNKGITKATYDYYRKNKGLPVQSVKKITEDEVKDIYFNNYYKASGADKISDPKLAVVVFDTATNMGVSRAKEFLSKSNGDVDKFLKLRKDKYLEFVKSKPSQQEFLQGWNNRVNDLKKYTGSIRPQKDSPVLLKVGVEKFFDDKGNELDYIDNIFDITPNYIETLSMTDRILPKEVINDLTQIDDEELLKMAIKQYQSNEVYSSQDLDKAVKNGKLLYLDNYKKADGSVINGYFLKK